MHFDALIRFSYILVYTKHITGIVYVSNFKDNYVWMCVCVVFVFNHYPCQMTKGLCLIGLSAITGNAKQIKNTYIYSYIHISTHTYLRISMYV